MTQLDHLALNVSNVGLLKDWYSSVLGLQVEFATERAVGLKDDGDFTLILTETGGPLSLCNLYFRVDDVNQTHADLASRGVAFLYPPQTNDWGFGAGLNDPDGRLIGLWDKESMSKDANTDAET